MEDLHLTILRLLACQSTYRTACINGSSHFRIRKLSFAFGALLNRLLDPAEPGDTSTDLREVPATFWHHACDGLLVSGDDNFFAASHAVEEFAESGLGFECGDGVHGFFKYD